MRFLLVVLAAACSSPAKTSEYPRLPGDRPEGQTTPTEHTCIPAGVYAVTFDLSSATITPHGDLTMEFCQPLAEGIPKAMMSRMQISYVDGHVSMEWPRPIPVETVGPCELEVTIQPVPAHFVFVNGHGTGTSTYSVGSQNPNEPNDNCRVSGAKLTIEPVSGAD